MHEPRRHDDGKSLLRAMVRTPEGQLIDLDALLKEVGARPLPSELWAEHATVASMAAEVRAARRSMDEPVRRRTVHRPVTRAAVAAATIVITAGSSLAVTGHLPDGARDFASEAFAMFVPARERLWAASDSTSPGTDQPFTAPELGVTGDDPLADDHVEPSDEGQTGVGGQIGRGNGGTIGGGSDEPGSAGEDTDGEIGSGEGPAGNGSEDGSSDDGSGSGAGGETGGGGGGVDAGGDGGGGTGATVAEAPGTAVATAERQRRWERRQRRC